MIKSKSATVANFSKNGLVQWSIRKKLLTAMYWTQRQSKCTDNPIGCEEGRKRYLSVFIIRRKKRNKKKSCYWAGLISLWKTCSQQCLTVPRLPSGVRLYLRWLVTAAYKWVSTIPGEVFSAVKQLFWVGPAYFSCNFIFIQPRLESNAAPISRTKCTSQLCT